MHQRVGLSRELTCPSDHRGLPHLGTAIWLTICTAQLYSGHLNRSHGLVSLLQAPLRASLVLLHDAEVEVGQGESQRPPLSCQETELLRSRGLNRVRVRARVPLALGSETISRERLLEEEPLRLSFDASSGQCIESVWGFDTPRESCGGGDLDCDGFFDEGLSCGGGD